MNLKSCIYLISFSKTLFFEIGTSFGIHNYCPESQPVLEKEVSHYKTQIRCTQKTKLAFLIFRVAVAKRLLRRADATKSLV